MPKRYTCCATLVIEMDDEFTPDAVNEILAGFAKNGLNIDNIEFKEVDEPEDMELPPPQG